MFSRQWFPLVQRRELAEAAPGAMAVEHQAVAERAVVFFGNEHEAKYPCTSDASLVGRSRACTGLGVAGQNNLLTGRSLWTFEQRSSV